MAYISKCRRLDFANTDVLQSLKSVLILANSAEADEMLHFVAFHLGLHLLQYFETFHLGRYLLMVFQYG